MYQGAESQDLGSLCAWTTATFADHGCGADAEGPPQDTHNPSSQASGPPTASVPAQPSFPIHADKAPPVPTPGKAAPAGLKTAPQASNTTSTPQPGGQASKSMPSSPAPFRTTSGKVGVYPAPVSA